MGDGGNVVKLDFVWVLCDEYVLMLMVIFDCVILIISVVNGLVVGVGVNFVLVVDVVIVIELVYFV